MVMAKLLEGGLNNDVVLPIPSHFVKNYGIYEILKLKGGKTMANSSSCDLIF